MKIISHGIVPQKRIWRGTCRTCETVAEAEEGELSNITHDQREGGRFAWCRCPVCSAGGHDGYGGMLFYPMKEGQ